MEVIHLMGRRKTKKKIKGTHDQQAHKEITEK
jgi:hypothetical protein